MIVELTKTQLSSIPNTWNGIVVLYSNYCGYCKEVLPFIKQFDDKYNQSATTVLYCVDESDNRDYILKNYANFRGVPDFFQLKGGKIFAPRFSFERDNLNSYRKLFIQ